MLIVELLCLEFTHIYLLNFFFMWYTGLTTLPKLCLRQGLLVPEEKNPKYLFETVCVLKSFQSQQKKGK